MDCFLPIHQLRCFIIALSFGCFFLWILSAQYMEKEQVHSGNPFPNLGSNPDRDAYAAQRQTRERSSLHGAEFIFHRRLLLEAAEQEANENSTDRLSLVQAETYMVIIAPYNPVTAKCSDIHKLNGNSSKCTYVKTVDSCQNDDGLLVYLNFLYCTIPYKLIPLTMIILFVWLVFLFIFLGATAEEYFCPSLTVISEVLHLNQNVAGVTLLALGNGAPDIFSAFAAINQSDDRKSSLAIGALFGAGIFVTTVVVGSVAFLTPFELTKRPFLRDIIFYTFAVYWTFYLLWTSRVDVYMAAGFIVFYILYVLVVMLGRIVYQRWRKEATKSDLPRAPPPILSSSLIDSSDPSKVQKNVVHHTALPPSPLVNRITTHKDVVPAIVKEDTSGEEAKESESREREKREESETLHYSDKVNTSNETESKAQVYQGGSLQVTTDDCSSEKSRLQPPPLNKPQGTHKPTKTSEKMFEASAPLFPQLLFPHSKPLGNRRSISPTPNQERGWKYNERRHWLTWGDEERPRSTSPRKLRGNTLTAAMCASEEVVSAVGLPYVHPHHHYSRNSLTASIRSHHSGGGEGSRHGSFHDEETANEEPTDEKTSLLLNQTKKLHPFLFLLSAFYPFGDDFKQLGMIGKIYEIVKYPCNVLLTLTVPVIDHEAPLHNWNRWLNIVHCVTGPLAVALLTKRGLYLIGGVFPVGAVVLIFGVIVAIIVACTSRNDKRPIYHCAFAWLGFAIAVVWIYIIANEIVNLLQAFGVVVKLSDGILGITLLAWGNSIGDAVANMTMARQGFPRMAIGACYGGPLLNILIGVGVASLYKCIKSDGHTFKLFFTQVEFFAAVFLMATLAISMATITLMKFRIYRPFALCLIAFYVIFLIVAILAEVPVFTISMTGVFTDN